MKGLGTKAETLQRLYGQLEHAKVLPQMSFTAKEWNTNQAHLKEEFQKHGWGIAAVRSSSLMEDKQDASFAGKYESVLNVKGQDAFCQAVGTVLASYDDTNPDNQVLVQPMLLDVALSGVAFTIDPNTLGNYYVVNYDDTGSTSAVTSGTGMRSCLYYQFKDVKGSGEGDGQMQRLCKALSELEQFFAQENLDVEFAFAQGELYILQVRTLCLKGTPANKNMQKEELKRICHKIKKSCQPKPFLCGKKTVYSVMTDWNPAEMIGVRPKALALSLYREMITDSVWAYQRDNYGYRSLRSFPLMVDFGGLPYIDVRVSFNSFIPAQLDYEISQKLVDYYIDRLCEAPKKHDKAEFEVVFSCYTLDLQKRIQVLKNYGFTKEEIDKIAEALKGVTNRIIDHENGLWRQDYKKLERLNCRYFEVMESSMDDIEKIYWLLEDCKRYGTLPFAGLARGAFIAVQILQSLVDSRVITESDYETFMGGVDTVSSRMKADFQRLSKDAFLMKYGHLRPGTYDITSCRYDEAPELYFSWDECRRQDKGRKQEKKQDVFRLSLQQLDKLKQKLCENGLSNDVLELFDFIKTVIEGREYGKFVFTRNLSMVLKLIENLGQKAGLSKEDCAYLNIHAIYELYSSTGNIQEELLRSVEKGKARYCVTQSITLPPVIMDEKSVMQFDYPDSEPNFITSGKASGGVCLLDDKPQNARLDGKVVLIPSADPGYDWIFSHHIKAFITTYGGANSHMAIRAGELGIPAAIGVGGRQFEKYANASLLEIDALAKTIRILK